MVSDGVLAAGLGWEGTGCVFRGMNLLELTQETGGVGMEYSAPETLKADGAMKGNYAHRRLSGRCD